MTSLILGLDEIFRRLKSEGFTKLSGMGALITLAFASSPEITTVIAVSMSGGAAVAYTRTLMRIADGEYKRNDGAGVVTMNNDVTIFMRPYFEIDVGKIVYVDAKSVGYLLLR